MNHYSKMGIIALLSVFGLISTSASSCERVDAQNNSPTETNTMENSGKKIRILVGEKSFSATLVENEAAEKFYSLLPLTVTMTELNRNEKYYRLPENLPTNASNPGTIRNGDLLLWGANTVVIFYETFSTTYSYTPLGKIDDPAGLKAALGSGNVTVTFEMVAL